MKRFNDLIALIREEIPNDSYWEDIEQKVINPIEQFKEIQIYQNSCALIDQTSWDVMKNKFVKAAKCSSWKYEGGVFLERARKIGNIPAVASFLSEAITKQRKCMVVADSLLNKARETCFHGLQRLGAKVEGYLINSQSEYKEGLPVEVVELIERCAPDVVIFIEDSGMIDLDIVESNEHGTKIIIITRQLLSAALPQEVQIIYNMNEIKDSRYPELAEDMNEINVSRYPELAEGLTCKELVSLMLIALRDLLGKKEPSMDELLNLGVTKRDSYDLLNETLAYQYLVESGHINISMLEENADNPTPDIEYMKVDDEDKYFCEVKTIYPSFEEIIRQSSEEICSNRGYQKLDSKYFKKLTEKLTKAIRQILAKGRQGLVYLVVHFNDWVGDYDNEYRVQLQSYLNELDKWLNVVRGEDDNWGDQEKGRSQLLETLTKMKCVDIHIRFRLTSNTFVLKHFQVVKELL